jgi:TolA-binding protein
MFRRLGVLILAGASGLALAANKEMQELQRDVALLQEQVKQLQQSQDKQLTALTVLVQQALDASNKANTSVAVIQNGVQQSLRDQEGKVLAPVAGLSARMDGMTENFRTLQQAVSELTNLVQKLQTQMSDLNNAMKVLQAPPPPPPGSTTTSTAPQGPGGAPDVPSISATDLYANAQRDRSGGKLDLALQEYTDYLRWYGSTDFAPNAQFYIGTIHYGQQNYDQAVRDFDMVQEKYPDNNNKMPDAFYYKGLALMKLNQRNAASIEFRELITRFPTNSLAPQACNQLKDLGLRCPAPAPARSSTPATKKKKS